MQEARLVKEVRVFIELITHQHTLHKPKNDMEQLKIIKPQRVLPSHNFYRLQKIWRKEGGMKIKGEGVKI